MNETIVDTSCCVCNKEFALDLDYIKNRKNGSGWCPYCGTALKWGGKTKEQIARERAELAERRAAELTRQLESERRSKSAIRGQLTRVRRRVAHGVCPCCKRTVRQLAAHMKSKHPDFAAEVGHG